MEKQMQTKVAVPMSSTNKPFKLIIAPELEHKIRLYCALSPEREWSGVLFYTFEGDFKNGVTIHANDMYLMDQGTHVHTEFDLNEPEITRYMVMEGLTGHCMALIHSHCSFQAFFSGEDSSTLYTYGMEMNNFVSLVVNNAGQYVARLTRKIVFEGESKTQISGVATSVLFNTDSVEQKRSSSEKKEPIKNAWVEYIDLEIEKPVLDYGFDEVSRFGEINHKCSVEKTKTVLKNSSPWDNENWNNVNTWTSPAHNAKKETTKEPKEVQGKLFEDSYDVSPDEINSFDWMHHGYQKWLSELIQGTPFIPSVWWTEDSMNKKYKEVFPNEKDFEFWFETWFDYMLETYDTSWMYESLAWRDAEELLCMKAILDIADSNLVYKENMISVIKRRIL